MEGIAAGSASGGGTSSASLRSASFCMVGPRGSGKTSQCGVFLHAAGEVDEYEMQHWREEAVRETADGETKMSEKETTLLAYRWTVTHSSQERARRDGSATFTVRGVYLSSDQDAPCCLVDCPPIGRFYRNFCRGASLGEMPVVCFPVIFGDDEVAETRDILHTLNAFRVGRYGVMVVVTKMDVVGYDVQSFERARDTILRLIQEVGFSDSEEISCWNQLQKERLYALFMCLTRLKIRTPIELRKIIGEMAVLSLPPITFVPVSALENIGIVSNEKKSTSSSLHSALLNMGNSRPPASRDVSPKFLVANSFRIPGTGNVICGRVLQGRFTDVDRVVVCGRGGGSIKTIDQMFTPVTHVDAGCVASLNVKSLPNPAVKRFQTQGLIAGLEDATRPIQNFTARMRWVGVSKECRPRAGQDLCLHVMSLRVHVQIVAVLGGQMYECMIIWFQGISVFSGLGFVVRGGSGHIDIVGQITKVVES